MNRNNFNLLSIGVPKELITKKMTAPDSAFMRNGDILLVKFQDKKASGEKEIFLIDSKGAAGASAVERYEKGNTIPFTNLIQDILIIGGVKKNIFQA